MKLQEDMKHAKALIKKQQVRRVLCFCMCFFVNVSLMCVYFYMTYLSTRLRISDVCSPVPRILLSQAAIAKEEKKEEESLKEANEIKVQVRVCLSSCLKLTTSIPMAIHFLSVFFVLTNFITLFTTNTQMGKYEQLTLDFQAKKADEEAQLEKIMEGLQEATAELRASLEVAQVSN